MIQKNTAKPALKAIIFDFNGVIINDEPIHLKMFQRVLSDIRISLSDKEYYKKYLAYDDQSCFRMILNESRIPFTDSTIHSLVQKKARYYRTFLESHLPLFAGIRTWIKKLSRRYPLAIASAALGREIRWILKRAKLINYFQVIVSAEDVSKSKPNPESYLLALSRLNKISRIQADECLVIEDSISGIKSAHRAGMQCLAVAHTYPRKRLSNADIVLSKLNNLRFSTLMKVFKIERAPD